MKKNLKHEEFSPGKRGVVSPASHLFNYADMSFYLFMKECHHRKTSVRLRTHFRAHAHCRNVKISLSNDENSSVSCAFIKNLMWSYKEIKRKTHLIRIHCRWHCRNVKVCLMTKKNLAYLRAYRIFDAVYKKKNARHHSGKKCWESRSFRPN